MKTLYSYENRHFEVYVNPDARNCIDVNVFEIVRPAWKIFRTKFIDSGSFWSDDYENIDEGVRTVIAKMMLTEKRNLERVRKWKEYETKNNT